MKIQMRYGSISAQSFFLKEQKKGEKKLTQQAGRQLG